MTTTQNSHDRISRGYERLLAERDKKEREEELEPSYKAKFAEGARSRARKDTYLTQEEWEERGLIMFKRRVLGFCGKVAEKPVSELANILTKLNIVDSAEDGEQFTRELYGKRYTYRPSVEAASMDRYGGKCIEFTKVESKEGEACRIHETLRPGWVDGNIAL